MKVITYVIAVLVMLIGATFALQGLSLLPSRVMYGRQEWVLIGGAMVLSGVVLIVFMRLRSARQGSP